MAAVRRMDPHLFMREPDGSVRIRIRFTREEADNIELAADGVPLLEWLHTLIHSTAAEEAALVLQERRNHG